MVQKLKIAGLIILDAICVNFAYLLALLLRFEFSPSDPQFELFLAHFLSGCIIATLIQLVIFYFAGLYRSLWRYASTEELLQIFITCIMSNAVAMAYYVLTDNYLPRSVYIIAGGLCVFFVGGIRFGYRTVRNMRFPGKFDIADGLNKETRIMLVGAGDAGATMIKEIKIHSSQLQKVVVAVDDNKQKLNQKIAGVKIAGNRDDIPRLVRRHRIDEIIIAIPTASKKQIQEIV